MNYLFRWTALVALGLLLGACSALPFNAEKPRITLADVSIAELGVIEQRFSLQLRIQNPNDFALPVNALSFELELNGQPFASGLSNRGITIPAFSAELLRVDAVSNISGLLRQFKHFEKGSRVRYQLKGFANVASNVRVPFSQTGEVELPVALAP